MEKLETLCYIQEQTSFPEDYKNNFGYKVVKTGDRFYLIFEAVLQSFGVLNRNGRIYELENIMERINNDDTIQTLLRNNSWIGEIDHPSSPYKDKELSIGRISTPDMKMSSHYIRKPRAEGNLLVANVQTDSSNPNGMNMAIKIVDGKIIPGFSARSFGALKNKAGRPVVVVKKLVTYDWVLYQSHVEALGRINQPLQESVDHFTKHTGVKIYMLPQLAQMAANSSRETEWLCESFGLTIKDITGLTKNGDIVIQENANIYTQPITDKQLRNKTRRILNEWINQ